MGLMVFCIFPNMWDYSVLDRTLWDFELKTPFRAVKL